LATAEDDHGTRQERRDRRRLKRRQAMPKHGASLARVYQDAVLRRLSTADSQKKRN